MSRISQTSPIVIIGMHRSGTTLMTKLLASCNIWMGYNVDKNHESRFFQKINKDILHQQGEFWFSCP